MSEQPGADSPAVEDDAATDDAATNDAATNDAATNEAAKAGATSQSFGNLTVEDDAEGTVNPADLAGTGGPEDDAVDG